MDTPLVVVLNGPAGVGKTTIGRRLAGTAGNGVCIHGDALKDFIVTRQDGTVDTGLAYVGGAALAEVYLRAGYDLVVFEFVFDAPGHVARFREAFTHPARLELVTLWAPLATVSEREPERPGRDRLGEQVRTCWQRMSDNLGRLGPIVDATAAPDAVLADVLTVLQNNDAISAPNRRDLARRAP